MEMGRLLLLDGRQDIALDHYRNYCRVALEDLFSTGNRLNL